MADDWGVDDADLRELTRLLQRPGAVAPADGMAVAIRSLLVSRGREDEELMIHYSVQPLPDGIARQPLPRDSDLATYAAEVAEELQAWAIGHVRKYRPLPPLDRNQVRRELPSRKELWRLLRAEFSGVRDVDGGFVATDRFGTAFRVMLTPEQWQEYVVGCEIGCRNDYGIDADSAGDGPRVAIGDLDEAMATMDPDESFLVLDARVLKGSTRAELPPMPGSAGKQKSEEILRRGGGGWYATYHEGKLSNPVDE